MDLNAQTKEEYFASLIEKERTQAQPQKQAPPQKQIDYKENDHETLHNTAKVITWLLCVIGVICGIVLIDERGAIGLAVIATSIIQLVFTLIFIHIAEDINAIRKNTKK